MHASSDIFQVNLRSFLPWNHSHIYSTEAAHTARTDARRVFWGSHYRYSPALQELALDHCVSEAAVAGFHWVTAIDTDEVVRVRDPVDIAPGSLPAGGGPLGGAPPFCRLLQLLRYDGWDGVKELKLPGIHHEPSCWGTSAPLYHLSCKEYCRHGCCGFKEPSTECNGCDTRVSCHPGAECWHEEGQSGAGAQARGRGNRRAALPAMSQVRGDGRSGEGGRSGIGQGGGGTSAVSRSRFRSSPPCR